MNAMVTRIDDLIAWIDRGPVDADIAEGMRRGLPIETFRRVLRETRERIIADPWGYDGAGLAGISGYVLDDMRYFERSSFGVTLHSVTNDLHHMSYVLNALRKAYALRRESDHPMLPRVIAYLEQIREMMGASWSWDVEGMAELCDEFRHVVAESARDLYRRLGDRFQTLLAFSPSHDDHAMPKIYRP
ncbi:MAG TPA: hypothetical protein PLZ36_04960 [Armatimonadota bacterium]|nr:hypothetical protein [Armatimonadota bacterium]HOS42486.1 hypothetical protein [Armatimonadota bacterium]